MSIMLKELSLFFGNGEQSSQSLLSQRVINWRMSQQPWAARDGPILHPICNSSCKKTSDVCKRDLIQVRAGQTGIGPPFRELVAMKQRASSKTTLRTSRSDSTPPVH